MGLRSPGLKLPDFVYLGVTALAGLCGVLGLSLLAGDPNPMGAVLILPLWAVGGLGCSLGALGCLGKLSLPRPLRWAGVPLLILPWLSFGWLASTQI